MYTPATATYLGAFVVEDSHYTDWHELGTGTAQSTAPKSKHKRHSLLCAQLDDCVEGLVQASCNKHDGVPKTSTATGQQIG